MRKTLMKNIKSKLVKYLAIAILSANPILITNCKKDSIEDYAIPGLECEFYNVYNFSDVLFDKSKKPIAERAECRDNQYDDITLRLIKYQKENRAKEEFEEEYEKRKKWTLGWESPLWAACDIKTCYLSDQCFSQRKIRKDYRFYFIHDFIRYKNFIIHVQLIHEEGHSNYTYFNLERERAWSLAKQQLDIITKD